MADYSILAGSTSQSILVDLWIQNTGAPQTALVFNSSGLTAYYSFVGANSTANAITLATQTVNTAWATGGFVKLSDTLMPGLYNFDIPNAAIAAAKGREVIVTFTGFAGMATRHIKIELTGWDNQNATTGGLTNLDAAVSGRMATYTQPTGFLAATFPSGTVANTTNITAGTMTTTTNLTNAPTAGDFTTTMKTSLNAATPASVVGAVGSVTGSVGSVVGLTASNLDATISSRSTYSGGAVSSVTGNVGGNVTGSVGSVVGAVGSVTGLTASDVGAIKTKTDSLNFTVAGQVNANAKSMNDTAILGTGAAGDLWRGS